MNDQLSILILNRIGTLPYIDKMSGIAKVYPYTQENESGSAVNKKIPVATYTTAQQCSGKSIKQYELIPDSRLKGLLYFEENAPIRAIENKPQGIRYESKIRLVCWLNIKLLNDDSAATKALVDICKRLTSTPFFHDPDKLFSTVSISIDSIAEKNAQIFSRYDYDEKMTQYLMYPFDYFALDLSVKYMIPFKSCIDLYNPSTGGGGAEEPAVADPTGPSLNFITNASGGRATVAVSSSGVTVDWGDGSIELLLANYGIHYYGADESRTIKVYHHDRPSQIEIQGENGLEINVIEGDYYQFQAGITALPGLTDFGTLPTSASIIKFPNSKLTIQQQESLVQSLDQAGLQNGLLNLRMAEFGNPLPVVFNSLVAKGWNVQIGNA